MLLILQVASTATEHDANNCWLPGTNVWKHSAWNLCVVVSIPLVWNQPLYMVCWTLACVVFSWLRSVERHSSKWNFDLLHSVTGVPQCTWFHCFWFNICVIPQTGKTILTLLVTSDGIKILSVKTKTITVTFKTTANFRLQQEDETVMSVSTVDLCST